MPSACNATAVKSAQILVPTIFPCVPKLIAAVLGCALVIADAQVKAITEKSVFIFRLKDLIKYCGI